MAPVDATAKALEQHRLRHVELHRMLDELITDFISHTRRLPSKTTCMELMQWSAEQCKNPTEDGQGLGGG